MPEIEFSELPEDLRVKLTEDAEKEIWHRIDEFGGVKEFTEHFEYSQSKLYNWKNKESFLPVKFVKRLMGGNNAKGIKALKGKGRSKHVEDLEFPVEISSELLTRVEASVSVNSEGTPVYITGEEALSARFQELMAEIGEVPVTAYRRSGRYEVRYPKFLQKIFEKLEFKEDLPALVDEVGEIEDGKVKALDKSVLVESFEGKLYSKEKKFELALEKEDEDVIKDIVSSEASKVESLLDR